MAMILLTYTRIAGLAASAAWHLAAYQLSVQLRGSSRQRALGRLQRWSRRACVLLRVDLQVHGARVTPPCLYVANHRSYLDIPVLSSVLGASFLSRADVAAWPVVGMVARETGAVFVDRDDCRSRARAALAVVRRADRGSVIVFPEGTTSGDPLPGAFATGIFRVVQAADVPVAPVTIRYSDRRAYWTDDRTLVEHARESMFTGSRLIVAVHLGAALHGADYATPKYPTA